LAQLLGNTQRIIRVPYDTSRERFSRRKLIPSNPKTLGDYLLLKRIEMNLSQPELAQIMGVTDRKIRAWERDAEPPTEIEWQSLAKALGVRSES
jgi:DNA-binding transcriptional regulator YiaG